MKCSRTGKSIGRVVSGHLGLGQPRERGMAKGEECVLKSIRATGALCYSVQLFFKCMNHVVCELYLSKAVKNKHRALEGNLVGYPEAPRVGWGASLLSVATGPGPPSLGGGSAHP